MNGFAKRYDILRTGRAKLEESKLDKPKINKNVKNAAVVTLDKSLIPRRKNSEQRKRLILERTNLMSPRHEHSRLHSSK